MIRPARYSHVGLSNNNSSALAGSVTDPQQFTSGRQFTA